MIKALIFDCFGVLVTESWDSFKSRHFGADQDKSDEASRIMDLSNQGRISQQDFLHMIGELAGVPSEQVQRELGGNEPNEPLFDAIYGLQDKYKIALLSNVAHDFLNRMFSEKQLSVFDVKALSYEMGLIKPDPQAYIKTAEMLDVEPGECVMVDDRQSYIEGAEQASMYGILYDDHEVFTTELANLLEITDTDK